MTFAPAFRAVVTPVAYFTFLLLFSGMHSMLNPAGINLSSASVELVSGIFISMLLLGLAVFCGISALRPEKPRCRITVFGSPMLSGFTIDRAKGGLYPRELPLFCLT